jgi:hypothetical protein
VSAKDDLYAESEVPKDRCGGLLAHSPFTITFSGNGETFHVAMWRPDRVNHWTMTFSDRAQALREYNKWAKVSIEP